MLKHLRRSLAFQMSFFFLTVTALVFAPLVAFAQTDAGIAPILGDPTDIHQMAQLVLNAVMTKQWGLLASLAVLITVASLRKYVPEKTKVGVWVRTRLGGIITNLLITLAGAFSTLFLSGAPFSLDMVLKALSIALGASGGWAIWKNIKDAMDEKKAQAAGEAAAAKPTDVLNQ